MDSSIEALLACRLITYTEKARVPKTLAIFIRNATHALTHEGRVDLGQNIRGDIFHHSASSTLFYAFSWFNPRNPFEYLSLGLDIVCQMTLHPSKGCSAFHLSKAEAFLAHPAFLKPFDTHRPSLQRVVLCGFSMGGGIATIMAMLLAERNTYPLTLVTFGTSRMGDAAFSSRLKEVCEPESQNIVLCRRRRAGREREREREGEGEGGAESSPSSHYDYDPVCLSPALRDGFADLPFCKCLVVGEGRLVDMDHEHRLDMAQQDDVGETSFWKSVGNFLFTLSPHEREYNRCYRDLHDIKKYYENYSAAARESSQANL
ncbi:unnamed protein product [Vitrella brassicaformis CCMP3155]|uniref:Fungal lipase-type domain-containing protein n=2 Tax=Vitrella brassicaformis TaxID=1169539 RepID=A0A0G4F2G6_VITBC|nr:unnamed protein product [Vitrella brassicaformis CCMP3155]|mmetsp:Transcript_47152/g.117640  ORF Transcript_47152/g.117640 Transcript_47152/m.117640 type:complete len:317 (+) Transcript_47152:77-1027(+)|eukprot:CEM05565.1 unnamed protein product [Vitrella brassicaformis CCMP3155]